MYDLADMVGRVGECTVQGFDDGMAFVSDVDDFLEVFGLKRVECSGSAFPAGLPNSDQVFARLERDLEFRIAITRFLLTVRGEKVGEA